MVYFGENVPGQSVKRSHDIVEASDGVLVIGSSLVRQQTTDDCSPLTLLQMVFSSFRFVKQAVASDKPVAIMNIGPTRADDLATLKLEASAAEVGKRKLFVDFRTHTHAHSFTLNTHTFIHNLQQRCCQGS